MEYEHALLAQTLVTRNSLQKYHFGKLSEKASPWNSSVILKKLDQKEETKLEVESLPYSNQMQPFLIFSSFSSHILLFAFNQAKGSCRNIGIESGTPLPTTANLFCCPQKMHSPSNDHCSMIAPFELLLLVVIIVGFFPFTMLLLGNTCFCGHLRIAILMFP